MSGRGENVLSYSIGEGLENVTHLLCTYLIARNMIYCYGAYQSGYCTDAIGHAHQNAGVTWCNIQMIDVVTRNSETTERNTEC